MNRIVPIIVVVLVAFGVLASTVFVVDQRQYAVVYALGEIRKVIDQPGLHFKLPPPFQNVQYFDRRILTIDTADIDRFITSEKLNIQIDTFVKWRIVDPRQFVRSVQGSELIASDRITRSLRDALNNEIAKRTVSDVISGTRQEIHAAQALVAVAERTTNILRGADVTRPDGCSAAYRQESCQRHEARKRLLGALQRLHVGVETHPPAASLSGSMRRPRLGGAFGHACSGMTRQGPRRAQFHVDPGLERLEGLHPLVERRVNQPDADGGQQHGQRRSCQGDFGSHLVGPFGGHLKHAVAGPLERIKQVDVKRHVGNAQVGVNPL